MKPSFFLLINLCLFGAAPAAAQEMRYDEKALAATIQSVSFEFCNEYFYRDEPGWKGRFISFSGYMIDKPAVGKVKSEYIQLTGTGVNGPISLIAMYDNKLPTKNVFGNDVPVVTTGQHLRFIAEIMKGENFVSVTGIWLYLPVVRLHAIYQQDDAAMRQPLWLSKFFLR